MNLRSQRNGCTGGFLSGGEKVQIHSICTSLPFHLNPGLTIEARAQSQPNKKLYKAEETKAFLNFVAEEEG